MDFFNRNNGAKLRISFEGEAEQNKAKAPELVDIKITDFCPYGCAFCYQDSTLKGKHASLQNLKMIAKEMGKNKIFEVALGGGETTLHPNFVEILKMFKEENVVPNFTTKNLHLLRQSNAKEIMENTGAVAFSIESVEDIRKVESSVFDISDSNKVAINEFSISPDEWKTRINFQLVMGVVDEKEFTEILKKIDSLNGRITLLGYKENGRGKNMVPHDYKNWLNIVKKFERLNISIDTALAGEYEKELKEHNVDPRTFHVQEGKFSAYVDAVKMKLYPSSYSGLDQEKEFGVNWLKDWQNINPVQVRKKINIKVI